MAVMKVDKDGQLVLPLEVCKKANLHNNDWLRVKIQPDCMLLIPSRVEIDEEIIEDFIHQGILINVKN